MVPANTKRSGNDAERLDVPESLCPQPIFQALELILFFNYKNVSYEKNKCYLDMCV